MLISESGSKRIWDYIKKEFGVMPHIHEQQIQEIDYRFVSPLLDLLVMSIDDLPSGNLIIQDLLTLMAGPLPMESLHIQSGLGSEESPDSFLKESVLVILKKYLVSDTSAESDIQSVLAMVYPIVYQLIHEYRLNKDPNRPDIDLMNMSRALRDQDQMPVHPKLSERVYENKENKQAFHEPYVHEIQEVVVACFSLKRNALELTKVADEASRLEKSKCLYLAAQLCFSEIIESLIKDKGADPNTEVDGLYPLMMSCYRGDVKSVKILLENGADVRIDKEGGTALYMAAQLGHAETVRVLLAHPEIGQIINRTFGAATPLFIASQCGHAEVVGLLLEAGADLTIDIEGCTALYAAAQLGHAETVRVLLAHPEIGQIINRRFKGRETPLLIASQGGHAEVVGLLLEAGADLTIDIEGATALYIAAQLGHAETVRVLLAHPEIGQIINRRFKGKETPLFKASANGHTEVVGLLLEAGADLTIDIEGCTALYIAAHKGHTATVSVLLAHPDIGQIINRRFKGKNLPLFIASQGGHTEIVGLLLEAGADLTIDIEGCTALHIAAHKGHAATVCVLLAYKDIGQIINCTFQDMTPVMIARKHDHGVIVGLLEAAERDLARRSASGAIASSDLCFAYKTPQKYSEEGIKALNFQGVEAFKAGNLGAAILLFLKVLDYWEGINKKEPNNASLLNKANVMSEASVLYNLGSAQMKYGRFSKAEGYLNRALSIAESSGAEKEKAKFSARLEECSKLLLERDRQSMPSP